MERAEWLRAASWVKVARRREATAWKYAAGSMASTTADTLAREWQENANSAWADAVVALLRALTA